MQQKYLTQIALAGLALGSASLTGQVLYSTAGDIVSENFDAPVGVLDTSNANYTWTDDSTIPGWYSEDPAAGIESQFAGGISATQRVYSFRYSADDIGAGSGRAFGTRTTNAGTFSFAFGITNDTGVTLTSADISFVTALWRTPNNNTSDSLSVGYAITDTSNWSDLSYTNVPTLSESYSQGASGGGVNADPNASGLFWDKEVTLSDLAWGPGETLYVRFLDGNGAGAWGIDNISFSAIPEPSTYAALFGLLALVWVGIRRRRVAA